MDYERLANVERLLSEAYDEFGFDGYMKDSAVGDVQEALTEVRALLAERPTYARAPIAANEWSGPTS
jgi:hypothetical protein